MRPGCERGLVGKPFSHTGLCDQHYAEQMCKIGDEMADQRFERDVRVQEEALRRFHAAREEGRT